MGYFISLRNVSKNSCVKGSCGSSKTCVNIDPLLNFPMAQQSNAPSPLAQHISVINPNYFASYPVDLAIVRKVLTVTVGNFFITDLNGNILFKVRENFLTLHHRRVLVDAAVNPILTLRKKTWTLHDRWEVFRGESSEANDLLFTTRRSSVFHLRTKLHVFLANNNSKEEDDGDLRVEGSWLERSCTVYAGKSSTVIAQMHKKHTVQSILIGKTKFTVTVYPNIDYAFIVALIVILDAINQEAEGGDGDVLGDLAGGS